VSIATVADAAVAVTRDGQAWSWGHNGQAGLGNGLHGDTGDPGQPTPRPVKGINDAIEVKAGSYGRHFIVPSAKRHADRLGQTATGGKLGAGISGDHQPTPKPIKLPEVEAYWLGGKLLVRPHERRCVVVLGGAVPARRACLARKGTSACRQGCPGKGRCPSDRLCAPTSPAAVNLSPASVWSSMHRGTGSALSKVADRSNSSCLGMGSSVPNRSRTSVASKEAALAVPEQAWTGPGPGDRAAARAVSRHLRRNFPVPRAAPFSGFERGPPAPLAFRSACIWSCSAGVLTPLARSPSCATLPTAHTAHRRVARSGCA
jgi:hypothetical protein